MSAESQRRREEKAKRRRDARRLEWMRHFDVSLVDDLFDGALQVAPVARFGRERDRGWPREPRMHGTVDVIGYDVSPVAM